MGQHIAVLHFSVILAVIQSVSFQITRQIVATNIQIHWESSWDSKNMDIVNNNLLYTSSLKGSLTVDLDWLWIYI